MMIDNNYAVNRALYEEAKQVVATYLRSLGFHDAPPLVGDGALDVVFGADTFSHPAPRWRVYPDGSIYSSSRVESQWTPDRLAYIREHGPELVARWKEERNRVLDYSTEFEVEMEALRFHSWDSSQMVVEVDKPASTGGGGPSGMVV